MRAATGSLDENVERLRPIIIEAVRKRMVSDVPLGAFLSGGVDSSLVVAMMTEELGLPVKTFSIGFAGTDETEHLYARQVAERLGTEHHEEVLEPDTVNAVTRVARMLDEPNGDSSCLPTYLLSEYTRRYVTVALSGDGGDEMFGGYGRYRDTLMDMRRWDFRLKWMYKHKRWFRAADGYLSSRWFTSPVERVVSYMGGMPTILEQQLSAWRHRLNDSHVPLMHRMRNVDVHSYLPGAVLAKVDRMSMQVALEVRCPLLDRDVALFAESVAAADCWRPPDETKRILKRLTMRYLPESIVNRKKMGFGLPSQLWSHDALLNLGEELLGPSSSLLADLIDRDALTRFLEQQRSRSFSVYQFWPLLILEEWLRHAKSSAISPRVAMAEGGRAAG